MVGESFFIGGTPFFCQKGSFVGMSRNVAKKQTPEERELSKKTKRIIKYSGKACSKRVGPGHASGRIEYFRDKVVEKVNYTGNTGGILTKDHQCAFVIQNCLPE